MAEFELFGQRFVVVRICARRAARVFCVFWLWPLCAWGKRRGVFAASTRRKMRLVLRAKVGANIDRRFRACVLKSIWARDGGAPAMIIYWGWLRFASCFDLHSRADCIPCARVLVREHLPDWLAWPRGQLAAHVQAHAQNGVAGWQQRGEPPGLPASRVRLQLAKSQLNSFAGAFNLQIFCDVDKIHPHKATARVRFGVFVVIHRPSRRNNSAETCSRRRSVRLVTTGGPARL